MSKYVLLIFVIVLLPLIPVFAEEPRHASGIIPSIDTTNDTNTLNHTEIIEWYVGIFAIIGGAIILIGILLKRRL